MYWRNEKCTMILTRMKSNTLKLEIPQRRGADVAKVDVINWLVPLLFPRVDVEKKRNSVMGSDWFWCFWSWGEEDVRWVFMHLKLRRGRCIGCCSSWRRGQDVHAIGSDALEIKEKTAQRLPCRWILLLKSRWTWSRWWEDVAGPIDYVVFESRRRRIRC